MLPLTFTKPVADIRFGITTMREKWEKVLGQKTSALTEQYLRKKYPLVKEEDNVLINSSVCPSEELLKQINALEPDQALVGKSKVIAMKLSLDNLESMDASESKEVSVEAETLNLDYVWDLFSKLDEAIAMDFEMITAGRQSQPISETNQVLGDYPIFLEEGAKIECSILNAYNGPIYIGKNAEVMEGSVVRGPFALGEHSILKVRTIIYGPTSIGPHSKVGGEVNNSIVLGYSNKAHDGFLGNSVIGEWCNLGAGTNTSNLKNTYDSVRIWNYHQESFVDTGLQFCGLIMGDHSKTSINSMLNTGTVVGVCANIFGAGFPRQFVTSFSWGGYIGIKKYNIKKAFQVVERVYARRGKDFDQVEKDILHEIYESTL